MNGVLDRLDDLVELLRLQSPSQWLVRTVGIGCGWLGLALMTVWFGGPLSGAALLVVGVAATVASVRPDSPAGVLTLVLVALWWLLAGADCKWWQPIVVGALLWCWHWAQAVGATGPAHARLSRRLLGRSTGHAAAVVAAGSGLGGLVWLVVLSPSPPRGWWWLAILAAVALVAAVVASRPGRYPRSPGTG